MKTYKANKRGFINYLIITSVLLSMVVFFLDSSTFVEKPFILLPLLSPLILLLWMYFNTVYKIENDRLIYRSGFLRGRIGIAAITEILKEKTSWIGTKPALAKDGLIIKFNKYDTVYIAPESNSELIKDLLTVNPQIRVID